MSTTVTPTIAAPPVTTQAEAPKAPGRGRHMLSALPWLAPALVLIVGVVLYPAGYMVYTAFRRVTKVGTDTGPAGWANFRLALTFPGVDIGHVFVNTFVWVIVVVTFTVVISLGLAQFLNKNFRGRKLVRLAVIVPWAASVIMTTSVFQYGLNPDYGIINKFLVDIGIISAPYGFTQTQGPAFIVAMVVAIFVSLPFTTYTILAGLQAVPGDVIEAAHVDGAGATARYFHIVLPILRPALAVAVLINIINVFNSLPILKVLTGSLPGYGSDITTTLIFKYKTTLGPGVASALSVVNFLVCLVIIAIYLVVVKPTKER
ncbi:carbohydrate ABC transporter permease [Nakamurella sp. PAMC28650]|jgi:multiple sugar transport system permease protein|uniref:carbohydrate ABC transporter permease n=1 Tax=Nakamurella sp. PAMC28650 TaxID=2762325 RepID=UPI00164D6941|nr:sugar ABC transporter permease [Nakamurella sp. PAMC28650]QNK81295.1 sugar ABC transporter permease [Nakamurella sp. PAMC28650]